MSHLGSDGKPFSSAELEQLQLALLSLLSRLPDIEPMTLDLKILCDWHAVLSAGIERMQPGRLRHSDITFGSYFGTPPAQIAEALAQLVVWHRSKWLQLETPDEVLWHATRLHAELIRIHPFWDGNGRLARALQSWLCWQGGVDAPVYRNREAYLAGLNRYHHARDLKLLMEVTRAAVVPGIPG